MAEGMVGKLDVGMVQEMVLEFSDGIAVEAV